MINLSCLVYPEGLALTPLSTQEVPEVQFSRIFPPQSKNTHQLSILTSLSSLPCLAGPWFIFQGLRYSSGHLSPLSVLPDTSLVILQIAV